MDIKAWMKRTKDAVDSAVNMTKQSVEGSLDYVQSALGESWIFGSNEASNKYDQLVDEKHYFLVPFRKAEVGYSLYSMRCLPEGVPPINDLPKRRIFHLPNEHATTTVEHILLTEARVEAERNQITQGAIDSRLNELADSIDKLDDRMFNGVLLIGGLVALVNPIAGAAVAAKALIPSIGMLLSKYGLRYAGDTVSSTELSMKIKSAERDVLKQFRGSKTTSIVNPLLSQLDKALDTTEFEFHPLLDVKLEHIDFGEEDRDRLRSLTYHAITNSYSAVLLEKKSWSVAKLGPEDVAWLRLIADLAND